MRKLWARIENGLYRVSNNNYPWSGKRFPVYVFSDKELKKFVEQIYFSAWDAEGSIDAVYYKQTFEECWGSIKENFDICNTTKEGE